MSKRKKVTAADVETLAKNLEGLRIKSAREPEPGCFLIEFDSGERLLIQACDNALAFALSRLVG